MAVLIGEGKLRPIVDSVFSFEDALKAYERQMSNRCVLSSHVLLSLVMDGTPDTHRGSQRQGQGRRQGLAVGAPSYSSRALVSRLRSLPSIAVAIVKSLRALYRTAVSRRTKQGLSRSARAMTTCLAQETGRGTRGRALSREPERAGSTVERDRQGFERSFRRARRRGTAWSFCRSLLCGAHEPCSDEEAERRRPVSSSGLGQTKQSLVESREGSRARTPC